VRVQGGPDYQEILGIPCNREKLMIATLPWDGPSRLLYFVFDSFTVKFQISRKMFPRKSLPPKVQSKKRLMSHLENSSGSTRSPKCGNELRFLLEYYLPRHSVPTILSGEEKKWSCMRQLALRSEHSAGMRSGSDVFCFLFYDSTQLQFLDGTARLLQVVSSWTNEGFKFRMTACFCSLKVKEHNTNKS